MQFFSMIGAQGRLAVAAAFVLGLVPGLAATAAEQQAGQQRFSESTDIVAVEVPVQVVRDGKPVRGLSAADFEVYEGRSKQPVTGFEMVDLAAITAAPKASPQAPAAARLPMTSRRKFLLLFDMGFSSATSMAKARQSAKDLLHGSFHPTDLVAVAAYFPSKGPQILLGFTSDRKLVEDAIEHLDPVQMRASGTFLAAGDPLMLGGGGGHEFQGKLAEAVDKGNDKNGTMPAGMSDGINPLTSSLERTERTANQRDMEQFTKALAAFGDTLAAVHGRKYVVLLSEGFDSTVALGVSDVDEVEEMDTHSIRGDIWNIDSDKRYGNTRAGSQLEKMLDALRRSDCVVQAVDIGGVRAGDDIKVVKSRGRDSLFMMANSTGGEFYPNFNNLGSAMEKMLDRTSVTYVLTFQPDVKHDGQYHKLRVELKNAQGARVVYRPGYYAPKPYNQQTAMEKVLSASGQVAAGAEGGPVKVAVLAAPFQQATEKAYVPVLIEIDGASLIGASQGNVLPAEVFAYALDTQGAVQDYFSEKLGLDLEKVGPAIRQTGLKLFGHLDLKPGVYSVRVLVRNGQTGAAGLKVASVEVPAFSQAGPVLLPPFFPEKPGSWLMVREAKSRQGNAPYPFMARNQPFIPASRPALQPGADAAMALAGYHLGAGPLTAQAVVMTAEGKEVGPGKVALLNRETASGNAPERLTATFRPPQLPPGEYELLLTLTDAQGASQTSVSAFVVAAPGTAPAATAAAVAKNGGADR